MHQVNACTKENGEFGVKFKGNPAIVVTCHGDFPTQEEVKKICFLHNKPITTFVKRRDGNKYDVRFYFPDGQEVSYCGHGTVAATHLLNKIHKKQYKNYTFLPNEALLQNTVQADIVDDNQITLSLPSYPIESIPSGLHNPMGKQILDCFLSPNSTDLAQSMQSTDEDKQYEYEERLENNNLMGLVYNPVLKDYIFIMHKPDEMHNVTMNPEKLASLKRQLINEGKEVRGIFFVSPSPAKWKKDGVQGIQTRCFVPSTSPSKCFEDIACGSFNTVDEALIEQMQNMGRNIDRECKILNIYALGNNTKALKQGDILGGRQEVLIDGHTIKLTSGATRIPLQRDKKASTVINKEAGKVVPCTNAR